MEAVQGRIILAETEKICPARKVLSFPYKLSTRLPFPMIFDRTLHLLKSDRYRSSIIHELRHVHHIEFKDSILLRNGMVIRQMSADVSRTVDELEDSFRFLGPRALQKEVRKLNHKEPWVVRPLQQFPRTAQYGLLVPLRVRLQDPHSSHRFLLHEKVQRAGLHLGQYVGIGQIWIDEAIGRRTWISLPDVSKVFGGSLIVHPDAGHLYPSFHSLLFDIILESRARLTDGLEGIDGMPLLGERQCELSRVRSHVHNRRGSSSPRRPRP
mmetsp:Transcript_34981/g.104342  ORF Transcript_34981/g.104342 Transcript_34981/m.104342 type:complete len:268 (+) Transcript_34981:290-1093(+)